MTKHRWRNSLKSFIRSYIDPEKDEELKGAKAEIDGKVRKILKFLREGHDDMKEQLPDLIEEFQNNYQSLYARYDHLTEELRKKAQSKHGNDSFSSSSDSDSDDESPREKSHKNGKAQDNLENTADIKQELEAAYAEVADLKRRLAAAMDEKEALNLEHHNALSKAEETERIIMDLRNECENYNEANSKLSSENAELVQKLEETSRYVDDLRSINSHLQQEKDALQLELQAENESLLLKVKDRELDLSSTINLKTEVEEQLKSKSLEISECLLQIESLKQELENKIAEQQKTVEEKENLVVLLKNQEDKISDFERTLIERSNEVTAIHKKMEDAQNEAALQIGVLTDQVNSLQLQLELLQLEKSQMEVQIERDKEESEGSLALAEKHHTELTDKIIEQDRVLKEKDCELIKLIEEHKKLEVQLQNCMGSLRSSEEKIKEKTEQFEKDIDTKKQEIEQLEEQIDDLKSELEIKADEMTTLVEYMRTTEVKQRLISQRLHVTQQELGEKEEIHQKRVEKLVEEKRLMEERIATLSEIIAVYKDAQAKLETEISDKVNHAIVGTDTFSVKFEEDYGHLESRIYEIQNELKVAANWIIGNNVEKDQLKKEVTSLLQQLEDEKQQVRLLKMKIEDLEMISQKNEEERNSLIKNMKQQKEKMEELEKVIGERDAKLRELERKLEEKDDGMLNLGVEKKEAIRQLCILIDHHQSRYDDLKDMILKSRGRRRLR
ncbi:COP1-interactive protein 1 [Andrographis paniculata]|uniref:COP1-interactive protein 1 n=1 Tax=Andrographis paniculata TaxID=175694 RepID=UPI0021E74622|nr:COP1-interactive protein 1 [Andrographis paniculata]XP_051151298.1 COP1-interactive protein 1 [Andrographis paniculata]